LSDAKFTSFVILFENNQDAETLYCSRGCDWLVLAPLKDTFTTSDDMMTILGLNIFETESRDGRFLLNLFRILIFLLILTNRTHFIT
jgi:hypothetical protein